MRGLRDSTGKVFKPRSPPRSNVRPSLPNATNELGVMGEAIVEPVFLSTEPDQHSSGPTVASDNDLLGLGEPEVARQVVLHLRQGDPAGLGCPAGRATLAPRLRDDREDVDKGLSGPGCWASCSGCAEGDVQELGASLAMLKPFSDHAQRQRLNTGLRFVLSCATGQDAGQIGNLRDPAAVCFALKLNLERQRSLRGVILPA